MYEELPDGAELYSLDNKKKLVKGVDFINKTTYKGK